MVFAIKPASKTIDIILDLTKSAEIEELAEQLTELQRSSRFESEASGLEERRLRQKIEKKQSELEASDILTLTVEGLPASKWEQIAVTSMRKIEGKPQQDWVQVVEKALKQSKITATHEGKSSPLTDEDVDSLLSTMSDWQLTELSNFFLTLNARKSDPKAALRRVSPKIPSSSKN